MEVEDATRRLRQPGLGIDLAERCAGLLLLDSFLNYSSVQITFARATV